jgi:hypothetical protein
MPAPPRRRHPAAERIVSDLEWLAADPRGRRILWRLWLSTGVFGPAVSDGSLLAFSEGRRSVGLEYWTALVTLSPTVASLALTENSASEGDGRRRQRDDDPGPDGERRSELVERWADIAGSGPGPEPGPGSTGR